MGLAYLDPLWLWSYKQQHCAQPVDLHLDPGFTSQMPLLSHHQQCRSTDGRNLRSKETNKSTENDGVKLGTKWHAGNSRTMRRLTTHLFLKQRTGTLNGPVCARKSTVPVMSSSIWWHTASRHRWLKSRHYIHIIVKISPQYCIRYMR